MDIFYKPPGVCGNCWECLCCVAWHYVGIDNVLWVSCHIMSSQPHHTDIWPVLYDSFMTTTTTPGFAYSNMVIVVYALGVCGLKTLHCTSQSHHLHPCVMCSWAPCIFMSSQPLGFLVTLTKHKTPPRSTINCSSVALQLNVYDDTSEP